MGVFVNDGNVYFIIGVVNVVFDVELMVKVWFWGWCNVECI